MVTCPAARSVNPTAGNVCMYTHIQYVYIFSEEEYRSTIVYAYVYSQCRSNSTVTCEQLIMTGGSRVCMNNKTLTGPYVYQSAMHCVYTTLAACIQIYNLPCIYVHACHTCGRYFMYRSRNIKIPNPNPNTKMTVNTIPRQI